MRDKYLPFQNAERPWLTISFIGAGSWLLPMAQSPESHSPQRPLGLLCELQLFLYQTAYWHGNTEVFKSHTSISTYQLDIFVVTSMAALVTVGQACCQHPDALTRPAKAAQHSYIPGGERLHFLCKNRFRQEY